MTGAEYIAEFLVQRGVRHVFLVTGGACAFLVDAIGRHEKLKYECFHHEQAAAMAADAVWRTNRVPGVTVVTSGPGATNLLTGIACSYFDSIPSIHFTGQVNQNEKLNYRGANVRQAGFQETKIVEMARPIVKYAVQVTNGAELKAELEKAYNIAISGRMGPVLIDVPMDVQKEEMGDVISYAPPAEISPPTAVLAKAGQEIARFLADAKRPLIMVGAGVGLGGAADGIMRWITASGIPFVASWNALTYFDHDSETYCGHTGVYGNRGANFLIQNCDRLLVLGSRLDNRQRSGVSADFGLSSTKHVVDIDAEELAKYRNNEGYSTAEMNLRWLPTALSDISVRPIQADWKEFSEKMKKRYFGRYPSTSSEQHGSLSPYEVVQTVNRKIKRDAIVVADDGANLCWVYQSFHRTGQTLFTAGGNSPMAYSLPASIGAALYNPGRQVICFTGDGSVQMNVQEFQTLFYHKLDVKVFILNNFGYGIIKQFQDLYFGSRYHATGQGYSQPDFGKVAAAYGLAYRRVEKPSDISSEVFTTPGPTIIDVILHPATMIEPKLEMGRSIEDQFPYLSDSEYAEGMIFSKRKARKGAPQ